MIFPTPDIFKNWNHYPMTAALLILNVLTFFLFFYDQNNTILGADLFTDKNLEYTGRIYYQFVQSEKMDHHLWQWSRTQDPNSTSQMKIFGSLALKDTQFVAKAHEVKIDGDQVYAEHWRKMMNDFSESYKNENLYVLGVSDKGPSPWAWLTYQFSHATILHLFSNCVFLFFLGCIIEKLLGIYTLFFVYILGGALGSVSYLWFNPESFVPMVGSSASVSALMCFYALYEPRRRVRYFYFLSPYEGHHGYIYLSPYLIIPLFMLSDISSLISAPIGSGSSVAYSAHFGGAIVGFTFAIIYRWIFRIKKIFWKEEVAQAAANDDVTAPSFWDDN